MTTPDAPLLTIGTGSIRVVADPVRGGRIAQITHDGVDLLIGRAPRTDAPTEWGCYPMVPWAGRIRAGQFTLDGERYSVPVSFGDHAMHGVGFVSPWHMGEVTERSIELRLDLPTGERWPFGGVVRQIFAVTDDVVRLTMEVVASEHRMPLSFGWHPWFVKPDRVDFSPVAMFRRDTGGIPTGELITVPPDGPWDDCFVNDRPITLDIGRRRIVLTSDCAHWVVYDEPPHASCFEPQTGPPDAFTIEPDVLDPGDRRSAWFELRITPIDAI